MPKKMSWVKTKSYQLTKALEEATHNGQEGKKEKNI